MLVGYRSFDASKALKKITQRRPIVMPFKGKKSDSREITIRSSAAKYLTYVASVGEKTQNIEVRYEDENIWLTQKMLGLFFNVELPTMNYHIKKIFADSELNENSVTRNFRITASYGKTYDTKHYNLQMIIAVGFKVNFERTVQFCKWINQIASEYTIKEWSMDDERLIKRIYLTDKYFILKKLKKINNKGGLFNECKRICF